MMTFYDDPSQVAQLVFRCKTKLPKSGDRFGKLEFTGRFMYCDAPPSSTSQFHLAMECKCECGSIRPYKIYSIRNSNVSGCYCQQRAHCSLLSEAKRIRHPHYKRLRNLWGFMHDRCYHETNAAYKNYGGRGISICQEWRESFDAFFEWAIANKYAPNLTIDRINNDGNYEAGNCQWQTPRQQCRNTRKNVRFTAWGETKCIVEWSEDPRCKVKSAALRHRLVVLKLKPEIAIASPVRKHWTHPFPTEP